MPSPSLGKAVVDGSREEEGMESFEFDELDEPSAVDRPVKRGPDDTQTLRLRRCDVCGVPMFFEEHEVPSFICTTCDVRSSATVTDLLLKGHRIPQRWVRANG